MVSAKNRLKTFLKTFPDTFIRTSEIMRWGSNEYSNRADRNARELANEGFLQRLSKQEAVLNGFDTREGVYKIIGN